MANSIDFAYANGLYRAALSKEYGHVWLRDSIYILLAYETLGDHIGVSQGMKALLDEIFFKHEHKLDERLVKGRPPLGHEQQCLHPRFDWKGMRLTIRGALSSTTP